MSKQLLTQKYSQKYQQEYKQEYQLALDFIKENAGLELTLIEKAHVSEMVKKSIKSNRGANRSNESDPGADAFIWFMRDYYDCPDQVKWDNGEEVGFFGWLENLSIKSKLQKKRNKIPEFFRKKQESAHMP